MKKTRKLVAFLMAAVLLLGMAFVPQEVQAAKKKPYLNKTEVTLTEGESVQLKLKNFKGKKSALEWESHNKKVVTVTQKGKVKAKGEGKTTVDVTVGGYTRYICTITVLAKPKSKLTKELEIWPKLARISIATTEEDVPLEITISTDNLNDDLNLQVYTNENRVPQVINQDNKTVTVDWSTQEYLFINNLTPATIVVVKFEIKSKDGKKVIRSMKDVQEMF